MKICIIANGYPDDRNPQWGCFERDQAFALKSIGHEVSILYLDCRLRLQMRKIGISKKKESDINIYTKYLMPTGWIGFFSKKIQFKIESKIEDDIFNEYIKELGRPDLIYAHFLWNIYYASFLKEKYGIPLVGIEHWSGLTSTRISKNVRQWGDVAYSKVDKLIAVSDSLRLKIQEHFGKESIVVHNMVGQEFINHNHSMPRKDGVFKIVSIGSLIHRKGYDVLIKALNVVKKNNYSWELIIVGDGPEKKQLTKMIKDYSLDHHIKLVGRKNKNEIINILFKSDLFVLPSRAENFSVAVLEALSLGLPVVATICGGIQECIDKKNGLLVPVDGYNALADSISYMINNNDNYDRIYISQDCKRKYAPQVIASQLTDIFENVIKK